MDADIIKEIRDALESERLLTARLVDSVQRVSQIASAATPEMRDMFRQWLELLGEQVLRECGEKGENSECDVQSMAQKIGIEETTLFSLLVSMHRAGRIRIGRVSFSDGDGKDRERCGCLA